MSSKACSHRKALEWYAPTYNDDGSVTVRTDEGQRAQEALDGR